MSDMIVRAEITDVPAIQEVAEATWPHTFASILTSEQIRYMLDWMYNAEILTSTIQSPGHSFWLFKEGNQTLGFAGIEHNYGGKPITKLHKIYVLPSAQGKQVGKQLLDLVVLEARNAGSKTVLLNVNKYNKATGFYERLGFRVIAEEVIDIGNGYVMDDYVMELRL